MPGVMESVSVLNSTIRTLLAVGVVGAAGYGGWYGYSMYNAKETEAERIADELANAQGELSRVNVALEQSVVELREKDAEIGQLADQVEKQLREIERLDTSMRLLKVDHRVARLSVIDQSNDPENGQLFSLVEFQELDERGEPLGEARQFKIQGDMVYVDSWVVKFDDKYVEQADIDRATSLVFFRRLFGEFQEPQSGFSLDQEGARPAAYGRGGTISDFEQRIWADFWNVANDEEKQVEFGIRAAHGDAPSIKIQKGKAYRIDLRASDGLSITPDGDIEPRKPAA